MCSIQHGQQTSDSSNVSPKIYNHTEADAFLTLCRTYFKNNLTVAIILLSERITLLQKDNFLVIQYRVVVHLVTVIDVQ